MTEKKKADPAPKVLVTGPKMRDTTISGYGASCVITLPVEIEQSVLGHRVASSHVLEWTVRILPAGEG